MQTYIRKLGSIVPNNNPSPKKIPKKQPERDKFLSYNLKDLNIVFLKHYKKEYNEFRINIPYQFSPFYHNNFQSISKDTTNLIEPAIHDDGVLPRVEFYRRDMLGYIKKKKEDLWLYDLPDGHSNDKLGEHSQFKRLQKGLFTTKDPLPVWFEYLKNNQFLVYKYQGRGLDKVAKNVVDRVDNVLYLYYEQKGNNIIIKWLSDITLATRFTFETINWDDFGWIKLDNHPNMT